MPPVAFPPVAFPPVVSELVSAAVLPVSALPVSVYACRPAGSCALVRASRCHEAFPVRWRAIFVAPCTSYP